MSDEKARRGLLADVTLKARIISIKSNWKKAIAPKVGELFPYTDIFNLIFGKLVDILPEAKSTFISVQTRSKAITGLFSVILNEEIDKNTLKILGKSHFTDYGVTSKYYICMCLSIMHMFRCRLAEKWKSNGRRALVEWYTIVVEQMLKGTTENIPAKKLRETIESLDDKIIKGEKISLQSNESKTTTTTAEKKLSKTQTGKTLFTANNSSPSSSPSSRKSIGSAEALSTSMAELQQERSNHRVSISSSSSTINTVVHDNNNSNTSVLDDDDVNIDMSSMTTAILEGMRRFINVHVKVNDQDAIDPNVIAYPKKILLQETTSSKDVLMSGLTDVKDRENAQERYGLFFNKINPRTGKTTRQVFVKNEVLVMDLITVTPYIEHQLFIRETTPDDLKVEKHKQCAIDVTLDGNSFMRNTSIFESTVPSELVDKVTNGKEGYNCTVDILYKNTRLEIQDYESPIYDKLLTDDFQKIVVIGRGSSLSRTSSVSSNNSGSGSKDFNKRTSLSGPGDDFYITNRRASSPDAGGAMRQKRINKLSLLRRKSTETDSDTRNSLPNSPSTSECNLTRVGSQGSFSGSASDLAKKISKKDLKTLKKKVVEFEIKIEGKNGNFSKFMSMNNFCSANSILKSTLKNLDFNVSKFSLYLEQQVLFNFKDENGNLFQETRFNRLQSTDLVDLSENLKLVHNSLVHQGQLTLVITFEKEQNKDTKRDYCIEVSSYFDNIRDQCKPIIITSMALASEVAFKIVHVSNYKIYTRTSKTNYEPLDSRTVILDYFENNPGVQLYIKRAEQ